MIPKSDGCEPDQPTTDPVDGKKQYIDPRAAPPPAYWGSAITFSNNPWSIKWLNHSTNKLQDFKTDDNVRYSRFKLFKVDEHGQLIDNFVDEDCMEAE